jgi:deoxyribodipyrimidine photo-lyase
VLHIVWLKKDLRLSDHAPLVQAAACAANSSGRVVALWVYEPSMWAQPDMSARHLQFANDALRELAEQIAQHGGWLLRMRGEMLEVLSQLRSTFGDIALYSHEETGNDWSYARDKAVMQWCAQERVSWHQSPSNGVVRRLLSHGGGRNRWSGHWAQRMQETPLATPQQLPWLSSLPAGLQDVGALSAEQLGLQGGVSHHIQRGGRGLAEEELFSFLHERGQYYRSQMSSPQSGAHSCSRISPHLAWGTLSVKEVVHATWARRQQLLAMPTEQRPAGYLDSLKSFEARLHWHCHFIQKLESEPEMEWRNVHRGFDGMREEVELGEVGRQRLHAWATGQTGYPFIDACMRSLQATGWINFRMRAMLMSFASYQLWLHWRHSGLHLARLFTDYEPGIHWSQCQMQSGVTGINTVRIYNPIKQSQDQDPNGHFIRRWVPELRSLETAYVHEPWKSAAPPSGYPAPIVELQSATRTAKERIYAWKNRPGIREQAAKVYDKHGSRNPAREGAVRSKRRASAAVSQPSSSQVSFDF